MRELLHGLIAVFVLAGPLSASAQAFPQDGLVESDPTATDPIGVDSDTDLSDVPGPPAPPAPETDEEIARRGPHAPRASAQRGAVVTAISGIRETHHQVEVTLAGGLAHVTTLMTFRSRARYPAEVGYRLAVPAGAALTELEVCLAGRCRGGMRGESEGAGRRAYDDAVRARRGSNTGGTRSTRGTNDFRGPGGDPPAPISYAEVVDDEGGRAIRILAAAIPARGSLTVNVRYLAAAPVVGGFARMTLPPRGSDPRAAPTTVVAHARDMVGLAVDEAPADGPLVRDAWYAIPIAARVPTAAPPAARVERFACGGPRAGTANRRPGPTHCARAVVTAGPASGPPVDLIVAIDASPSTEGPARGRIAAAVAALLAGAPPRSRVWALAFGAEAAAIVDTPRAPGDVPLLPLARAVTRELGAATRFEAAWGLAERWLDGRRGPRRAHLVVVGDGGITRGPASAAAFAAARGRGVTVSLIDVADRAPWAPFREGVAHTGGQVIEAGAAAEGAGEGRGAARLEEQLSRLFAPVVARRVTLRAGSRRIDLGELRAGEQLAFAGPIGRPGALRIVGVGAVTVTQPDASRAAGLAALTRGDRESLVAIDRADLGSGAQAGDATCIDGRGPAQRPSGVSSDAAPVALAEIRACAHSTLASGAPTAPTAPGAETSGQDLVRRREEATSAGSAATSTLRGRGIPAETVLRMLRRRVQPVARRCFRRDRAGRLDYAVRAEFVIRLEDRELTEARVDGEITDGLRTCLSSAVHDLEIPRFRGAVIVRYPLYTERVPRPPTIELVPEVARQVDAVTIDGPGN
ncbi:MAG: hypothetical protein JRH11_21335 [Deltaproteobacteria bacterium]|nr:hypothetical protein [Deltaproteobacteria bacterium]